MQTLLEFDLYFFNLPVNRRIGNLECTLYLTVLFY